ncbi:hypothetical protein [Mycolicibacterium sp.]|uniref:hypothetical protein n=1 Tax=Mycolicibacterium sp. TaxID=2320850 RepID=UPI0037CA9318
MKLSPLKHYPGRNDAECASHFGPSAAAAQDRVRELINEAMRIEPDWTTLSLSEAGDYVESVMRDRHPELSAESLECIGNCSTYQMR